MDQTAHKLPIHDAFREGWNRTTENLRAFVALGLVNLLLSVAQQSTLSPAAGATARPLPGLLLPILQLCLWLIYLRFALALCDGREIASLLDKRLLRGFLAFAMTALLYGLIVGTGLVLFVIPGVIWALRFAFAAPLAVDRELDPIAALKESARLTNGVKGGLLGFLVLCLLLNALGGLLMGLGLILTVPVTMIAQAYLLRHLQTRSREFSAPQPPPALSTPSPA